MLVVIAVSACGGGSRPSIHVQPNGSTPSADVVKSWASKWCSVQPGVPKSTLYNVMGNPTSKTAQTASWDGFGWQFNAFLDENGNIRQMDINTIGLDASQKSKITCGTTRIAGNTSASPTSNSANTDSTANGGNSGVPTPGAPTVSSPGFVARCMTDPQITTAINRLPGGTSKLETLCDCVQNELVSKGFGDRSTDDTGEDIKAAGKRAGITCAQEILTGG